MGWNFTSLGEALPKAAEAPQEVYTFKMMMLFDSYEWIALKPTMSFRITSGIWRCISCACKVLWVVFRVQDIPTIRFLLSRSKGGCVDMSFFFMLVDILLATRYHSGIRPYHCSPMWQEEVKSVAVLGTAEQLELGDHGSSAVKPSSRQGSIGNQEGGIGRLTYFERFLF